MPTYRSSPLPGPATWAARAIGTLDRLGVPASRQLSRRGLWGAVPRRAAPRPDGRRLLALSFDLDYQADTDALPALIDLLGRAGAPATMFSVGRLVEQDPEPYRAALAAGHEIGNHTWSHPDNPVLNPDREFWDLTVDEMAGEIGRAQDVLEHRLGVRPVGFRTPHFKDAFRMMQALERTPEITYVSTALASKAPLGVPYFPTREPFAGDLSLHFSHAEPARNHDALMIPLTPSPGARWSPFCSYHSLRRPTDASPGAGRHTPRQFAALWHQMLAGAWDDGFASVYFDPLDVMRDAHTADVFEAMLTDAASGGWAVAPLREVEQAWRPFLDADTPAR